eukprot:TRINITY_DN6099_c0_g1_i2.p1 TRINITY_DN6099_c0_g1~~TRINITY_DN6099_c0_g1_i2.p1  ORF type:complete len:490 (-),score=85.59 TRINITY_DN6099_c0_g1_i2:61-1530(-)
MESLGSIFRPLMTYIASVSMFRIVSTFLIIYAIWEFFNHRSNKGRLPGPPVVLPFLGQMFEVIYHPWNFYTKQATYGDISWSSAFGKSILFTRKAELTKEVFNSPSAFTLWLVWGAKSILGRNNIAFMTGEPHKALRKRLLPLFTLRSLAVFLPIQERATRKFLEDWCKNQSKNGEKTFCVRPLARDLNIYTSSSVFVGPYINDAVRNEITDHYWTINYGFLSFPYDIPFTPHRKAVRSRETLTNLFTSCATKSLEKMAKPDAQPECLVDLWMEEEIKTNSENPMDHKEIGLHIFDFLFASQDASTASIVWVMALLDQFPEVREKVLEEQLRVRPNDEPITMESIKKMVYTKQVVMELLRYRPPATMVPHMANVDTQIDGHNIKKGTVILPSIWESHLDSYENPEVFDPERFNPQNEDRNGKKFMAFGAGPHRCIGMTYAINHLITFMSVIVRNYDWKREHTKGGDEIIFMPTIFPKDGCIISMQERRN